ncbi:hypothetical protein BESB_026570 [Besnoitia besnoiti]|uniref:Uncharacterized protein n=1 Tax=Besnoitia besnoiti TaxID=94643 RepID=A0A2A9M7N4_BESBE|nr:uncharacterized protein BESB_026570 [Besnoitia besnoiti]PFH31683.1 hypothetical protein BESB_026570 [Besnoitia besnoiti]
MEPEVEEAAPPASLFPSVAFSSSSSFPSSLSFPSSSLPSSSYCPACSRFCQSSAGDGERRRLRALTCASRSWDETTTAAFEKRLDDLSVLFFIRLCLVKAFTEGGDDGGSDEEAGEPLLSQEAASHCSKDAPPLRAPPAASSSLSCSSPRLSSSSSASASSVCAPREAGICDPREADVWSGDTPGDSRSSGFGRQNPRGARRLPGSKRRRGDRESPAGPPVASPLRGPPPRRAALLDALRSGLAALFGADDLCAAGSASATEDSEDEHDADHAEEDDSCDAARSPSHCGACRFHRWPPSLSPQPPAASSASAPLPAGGLPPCGHAEGARAKAPSRASRSPSLALSSSFSPSLASPQVCTPALALLHRVLARTAAGASAWRRLADSVSRASRDLSFFFSVLRDAFSLLNACVGAESAPSSAFALSPVVIDLVCVLSDWRTPGAAGRRGLEEDILKVKRERGERLAGRRGARQLQDDADDPRDARRARARRGVRSGQQKGGSEAFDRLTWSRQGFTFADWCVEVLPRLARDVEADFQAVLQLQALLRFLLPAVAAAPSPDSSSSSLPSVFLARPSALSLPRGPPVASSPSSSSLSAPRVSSARRASVAAIREAACAGDVEAAAGVTLGASAPPSSAAFPSSSPPCTRGHSHAAEDSTEGLLPPLAVSTLGWLCGEDDGEDAQRLETRRLIGRAAVLSQKFFLGRLPAALRRGRLKEAARLVRRAFQSCASYGGELMHAMALSEVGVHAGDNSHALELLSFAFGRACLLLSLSLSPFSAARAERAESGEGGAVASAPLVSASRHTENKFLVRLLAALEAPRVPSPESAGGGGGEERGASEVWGVFSGGTPVSAAAALSLFVLGFVSLRISRLLLAFPGELSSLSCDPLDTLFGLYPPPGSLPRLPCLPLFPDALRVAGDAAGETNNEETRRTELLRIPLHDAAFGSFAAAERSLAARTGDVRSPLLRNLSTAACMFSSSRGRATAAPSAQAPGDAHRHARGEAVRGETREEDAARASALSSALAPLSRQLSFLHSGEALPVCKRRKMETRRIEQTVESCARLASAGPGTECLGLWEGATAVAAAPSLSSHGQTPCAAGDLPSSQASPGCRLLAAPSWQALSSFVALSDSSLPALFAEMRATYARRRLEALRKAPSLAYGSLQPFALEAFLRHAQRREARKRERANASGRRERLEEARKAKTAGEGEGACAAQPRHCEEPGSKNRREAEALGEEAEATVALDEVMRERENARRVLLRAARAAARQASATHDGGGERESGKEATSRSCGARQDALSQWDASAPSGFFPRNFSGAVAAYLFLTIGCRCCELLDLSRAMHASASCESPPAFSLCSAAPPRADVLSLLRPSAAQLLARRLHLKCLTVALVAVSQARAQREAASEEAENARVSAEEEDVLAAARPPLCLCTEPELLGDIFALLSDFLEEERGRQGGGSNRRHTHALHLQPEAFWAAARVAGLSRQEGLEILALARECFPLNPEEAQGDAEERGAADDETSDALILTFSLDRLVNACEAAARNRRLPGVLSTRTSSLGSPRGEGGGEGARVARPCSAKKEEDLEGTRGDRGNEPGVPHAGRGQRDLAPGAGASAGVRERDKKIANCEEEPASGCSLAQALRLRAAYRQSAVEGAALDVSSQFAAPVSVFTQILSSARNSICQKDACGTERGEGSRRGCLLAADREMDAFLASSASLLALRGGDSDLRCVSLSRPAREERENSFSFLRAFPALQRLLAFAAEGDGEEDGPERKGCEDVGEEGAGDEGETDRECFAIAANLRLLLLLLHLRLFPLLLPLLGPLEACVARRGRRGAWEGEGELSFVKGMLLAHLASEEKKTLSERGLTAAGLAGGVRSHSGEDAPAGPSHQSHEAGVVCDARYGANQEGDAQEAARLSSASSVVSPDSPAHGTRPLAFPLAEQKAEGARRAHATQQPDSPGPRTRVRKRPSACGSRQIWLASLQGDEKDGERVGSHAGREAFAQEGGGLQPEAVLSSSTRRRKRAKGGSILNEAERGINSSDTAVSFHHSSLLATAGDAAALSAEISEPGMSSSSSLPASRVPLGPRRPPTSRSGEATDEEALGGREAEEETSRGARTPRIAQMHVLIGSSVACNVFRLFLQARLHMEKALASWQRHGFAVGVSGGVQQRVWEKEAYGVLLAACAQERRMMENLLRARAAPRQPLAGEAPESEAQFSAWRPNERTRESQCNLQRHTGGNTVYGEMREAETEGNGRAETRDDLRDSELEERLIRSHLDSARAKFAFYKRKLAEAANAG